MCLGQWQAGLSLTIQSMLVCGIAGSWHGGIDRLLHESHRRRRHPFDLYVPPLSCVKGDGHRGEAAQLEAYELSFLYH